MAHYCLFPTPIGECGIAWANDKIIATMLPGTDSGETEKRLIERSDATASKPTGSVQSAIKSITALLSGEKLDLLDIICDFDQLDAFSGKVLAATRQIMPGKTCTYGDIAAELGDKLLSRRVGQSLGRNPFPIIVPCHRVMGANGKLTGFSAPGGVNTKLKLLEIEKASIGDGQALFDHLPLVVKPRG